MLNPEFVPDDMSGPTIVLYAVYVKRTRFWAFRGYAETSEGCERLVAKQTEDTKVVEKFADGQAFPATLPLDS